MMGRILRIELRRSMALGFALFLLVLGLILLLSFPQGFAGRWMQLAASGRSLLMLLWPLALAGGAWLGRRDSRTRVEELFGSTARPRWQRVIPTACAFAGAMVGVYVLMLLAGVPLVAPTAGFFPAGAIGVTAVGALSLVAASWLGMAAGRAVPRVITAPVLAVLGFALMGLLPDWLMVRAVTAGTDTPAPAAMLLSPVLTGSLDDFETITTRVNLVQALWLVALAVTGMLLLGAVGRRSVAVATLPALLGAAVTVPLMPAGGYNAASVVDPKAIELVCDDNGPQVCVTRAHAGLLPDLVGPARQALAMMAAKLPNAPTRAVESQQLAIWKPGRTPEPEKHQADTIRFFAPSIGNTGRARLDREGREDLSLMLLESAWPEHCGEPSHSYEIVREVGVARAVGAGWLAGRSPRLRWTDPEEQQRAEAVYQALIKLPEDEQRRRMTAARDAAITCRTDALTAIVKDAS